MWEELPNKFHDELDDAVCRTLKNLPHCKEPIAASITCKWERGEKEFLVYTLTSVKMHPVWHWQVH